jgi:cytochrome c-type biogenesis protein CcmH
MRRAALLAVALMTVAAHADPAADEARARALDAEIRCVACENEPISQSTADIAVDMRALVRERIAAGDTDAEIRAYFAERYGEFVLLRPKASALTWPLWAAPLALLAVALLAAGPLLRRRPAADEPAAADEDER